VNKRGVEDEGAVVLLMNRTGGGEYDRSPAENFGVTAGKIESYLNFLGRRGRWLGSDLAPDREELRGEGCGRRDAEED
jgi:hypothetical protein